MVIYSFKFIFIHHFISILTSVITFFIIVGDEAWKLQSEFNNLIEYGSIRRTNNGELIKTYYKSCKTG